MGISPGVPQDTTVGMASPPLGKSRCPDPPPVPLWQPPKGEPHVVTAQWGWRDQLLTGSPLASPHWLIEMETSAPCLTPLCGGCWLCCSLSRIATWPPRSAFAGIRTGGARGFPVVFAWCVTIIFFTFPVLLSCPLPGPFTGGQTFKNKKIYLFAGLGPSCSTWDLSLQLTDSLVMTQWLSFSLAYGILVPRPGIKAVSPASPRADFCWHFVGLHLLLVFQCYWVLQLQIYIH